MSNFSGPSGCRSSDLLPLDSPLYDYIASFGQAYAVIHPYVAVSMTIFSNIINILNLIVLTRPSMISSVNAHLAAIAIADFFTTFVPLFRILNGLIYTESYCPVSFIYALYLVLMGGVSFVAHSTSLWLSVFMAFTRYLTLRSLTAFGNQWYRSTKAAWIANVVIFALVAALNTPMFLSFSIYPAKKYGNCTVEGRYESSLTQDCTLRTVTYWMSGIPFKLLPCLLLTLLSVKLLRVLRDARIRRQLLSGALMIRHTNTVRRKARATDRTTKMMITLLVIFLICEAPQGLMYILETIFGDTFKYKVIYHLWDIYDLLSLINCSVNFGIYCLMSEAFRKEFQRIFIPKSWHQRAKRRQDDATKADGLEDEKLIATRV